MKNEARQQSIEQHLNGHRITAVIPAINEANNLKYVLPFIPPIVDEVLIVDGHSKDDTVAVAKTMCPDVRIIYQSGKGKGDALRCGIEAASHEIVVTLDADGSTEAQEIPRFIAPLLQGYDFTKGSRFLRGGGTEDMPWYRKLGCKAFVFMVWIFYGRRYTDLCYGYNAFWKNSFEKIEIDSDGFAVETEIHLRVIKAGLKVMEVPSFEHKRKNGNSNLRTIRDGWGILMTILRERFRR